MVTFSSSFYSSLRATKQQPTDTKAQTPDRRIKENIRTRRLRKLIAVGLAYFTASKIIEYE